MRLELFFRIWNKSPDFCSGIMNNFQVVVGCCETVISIRSVRVKSAARHAENANRLGAWRPGMCAPPYLPVDLGARFRSRPLLTGVSA